MNLQHLRYFVTLADLEHYTQAAEQLHITQPTLSHAITLLETEIGVSLLQKSGRNVSLTEEGKMFRKRISRALKIIDDSVSELQSLSQDSYDVQIALLRTLSHRIVPNILRDFLDHFPKSRANFVFHNDSGMSYDMLDGLLDKKYDLAFCSKIDSYRKDISFTPIARQDLVIIVPKNHPLSQIEQLSLKDTVAYPQIWFSKQSGMRPVLDDLFADSKEEIDIAFEIAEDETIAGLVAQNFGIAILPRFDFLKIIDGIDILELNELKNRRVFYMAYLKSAYRTPALKDFIDFIGQHYNVDGK